METVQVPGQILNMLGTALVVIYLIVKELRERKANGDKSNHPDTRLRSEVASMKGTSDARWEEQRRFNARIEEHIKKLYDKMEGRHGRE
jgi:hypothetical protein